VFISLLVYAVQSIDAEGRITLSTDVEMIGADDGITILKSNSA
jgi:hypothetical protein